MMLSLSHIRLAPHHYAGRLDEALQSLNLGLITADTLFCSRLDAATVSRSMLWQQWWG
jgi:hypothetical protein